MSKKISLGAINKLTGEYVYPNIAIKKDSYICPDCNKDLILCKGEIVIPYFRHKADNVNPCNYYDKPNESQIHKDAKLLLKRLLEDKKDIQINRVCNNCSNPESFEIPIISDTSKIVLEYRLEHNGLKIADIAYLDNNELISIFEICNTHKTSSEDRPDPWFEIHAHTLIEYVNENKSEKYILNCIRSEKCEECIEKDKLFEKNKLKAAKILKDWIQKTEGRIYPFECRDIGCDYGTVHCCDDRTLDGYNGGVHFDFDVIVCDKGYPRYGIDLTENQYPLSVLKPFIDMNFEIYYIDMNWILRQKGMPGKIIYKSILDYFEDTIRDIDEIKLYDLDLDKNTYLNVPFSRKELIKKYGGKFNSDLKCWYVKKSVYDKNEEYINEFIGQKIHFIMNCNNERCHECKRGVIRYNDCSNYLKQKEREKCYMCGGSGESYKSDDIYGPCDECCCSYCEKFNDECQCKYCEKCENCYSKDEEHICYLCEKCGEYVRNENSLKDHCKECCICHRYKTFLDCDNKCYKCSNLGTKGAAPTPASTVPTARSTASAPTPSLFEMWGVKRK